MAKEREPSRPFERQRQPVRRDGIHPSEIERSIRSAPTSETAKEAAFLLFNTFLSVASGVITVGTVLALFGSAVAAAMAGGGSTVVVFGLITIARHILRDARSRRN